MQLQTTETKIDIKNYNINDFVRYVFNLKVSFLHERANHYPTITKTS